MTVGLGDAEQLPETILEGSCLRLLVRGTTVGLGGAEQLPEATSTGVQAARLGIASPGGSGQHCGAFSSQNLSIKDCGINDVGELIRSAGSKAAESQCELHRVAHTSLKPATASGVPAGKAGSHLFLKSATASGMPDVVPYASFPQCVHGCACRHAGHHSNTRIILATRIIMRTCA
eukprot:1159363-Pelagomonas_calceolata.AAC.9